MLRPTGTVRHYAPRLPQREDGKTWHRMTVSWWHDVWHSPMAVEFQEADKHALFRLATLVDLFWVKPSKDLAAEIRLEQQAFGLTPIDRRRLQWSIEEEEQRRKARQTPEPTSAPAAEPEPEREDPRKLLKMVASK